MYACAAVAFRPQLPHSFIPYSPNELRFSHVSITPYRAFGSRGSTRHMRSTFSGERHLQLSFHTSTAMPPHTRKYMSYTHLSAENELKTHGRKAQLLLLSLENGRAAGVRGRHFTSKGEQRAAHMAASPEMWPRESRA